jgi:CheY-like chemotaxis protein
MPQGGKLTIETSRADLDADHACQHASIRPGQYALLAVSDTGSGMGADLQAHVFEPFFTTKGQGKGTGLGLSTVYGIVKQSGGDIEISSKLGEGTTITIYLPYIEKTAEKVGTSAWLSETPSGSETILVVEDEEMVRQLACEALRKKGYTVLEAASGEKALRICQQNEATIHLMLTDVVMPGMNGRELATRIASIRPATKVLYMSGYTEDAVLSEGILDSGLAFIQKPFTLAVLARKVREVLGDTAAVPFSTASA